MVAQRLGILVFCPDLLCDWVWKVRGRGSYQFPRCFFFQMVWHSKDGSRKLFFGRNESCFQIHSPNTKPSKAPLTRGVSPNGIESPNHGFSWLTVSSREGRFRGLKPEGLAMPKLMDDHSWWMGFFWIIYIGFCRGLWCFSTRNSWWGWFRHPTFSAVF